MMIVLFKQPPSVGQVSTYIRKFPNQNEFKYVIEEAGFKMVTCENFCLGICSSRSGFKI